MPRPPTRREREREHRARLAVAQIARIRSGPIPQRSAPDGDLYALRWEHDGLEYVAQLGQPVGHGYSQGRVIAIKRGDPYLVIAVDRLEGAMVGTTEVRDEVEFSPA